MTGVLAGRGDSVRAPEDTGRRWPSVGQEATRETRLLKP